MSENREYIQLVKASVLFSNTNEEKQHHTVGQNMRVRRQSEGKSCITCNIHQKTFLIAKHIAKDLRNDKIDSLSHLCIRKLITKNFFLIDKIDKHRAQITSF